MKICVIGLGYVGIPAAVLLASAGHDVTGIQRRSKRSGWKIDWLNTGKCPIANEPELPGLLAEVVRAGRFRVTDDYAAVRSSDMILIDVQTPTDENHVPRYESLREVSHTVGKLLRPGQVVVIESTVAPGTTQYLVRPILEEESGLKAALPQGFGLCFSYERVMVGRLIHNIREYPKIVGGVDEAATEKAMAMYRTIVKGGVHGTDPMTSEVSKTVENAYRDVQIAFANEVALLCESLGIDVYEVRKFVNGLPNDPSRPAANPVRNMHFPGAGVGGHCLPKDTWLLMHGYNTYGKNPTLNPQPSTLYPHNSQLITHNSPSLLITARLLNDWMPVHMADLLEEAVLEYSNTHNSPSPETDNCKLSTENSSPSPDSTLNPQPSTLTNLTISILGYAFLENSDDARNTPTLPFVRELARRGASFVIHDPCVSQEAINTELAPYGLSSSPYPATQNSKLITQYSPFLLNTDALVLMTAHNEYKSLTPDILKSLLKSRIIVDGRNLFDPAPFIRAGFIFKGVGKGNLNR